MHDDTESTCCLVCCYYYCPTVLLVWNQKPFLYYKKILWYVLFAFLEMRLWPFYIVLLVFCFSFPCCVYHSFNINVANGVLCSTYFFFLVLTRYWRFSQSLHQTPNCRFLLRGMTRVIWYDNMFGHWFAIVDCCDAYCLGSLIFGFVLSTLNDRFVSTLLNSWHVTWILVMFYRRWKISSAYLNILPEGLQLYYVPNIVGIFWKVLLIHVCHW